MNILCASMLAFIELANVALIFAHILAGSWAYVIAFACNLYMIAVLADRCNEKPKRGGRR